MIYNWTLNVTYNVDSNCTVNPNTTPFEDINMGVGSSNYQNIETYNWTADDVNPNTDYCSISIGASYTIVAYGECATPDILNDTQYPTCEQDHSHTVVVSYNQPSCECESGTPTYGNWALYGACGSDTAVGPQCNCEVDEYCERQAISTPNSNDGTIEDCLDSCSTILTFDYRCIGGCVINGCTDNTACNYDSDANTDDGSCTYPNQDMGGNQCGEIPECPECNVDDLDGTCAEQPFLCCLDDTGNGGCDVNIDMEIISSITVCPTWEFTGTGGCPTADEAAENGFPGNYVPYDNNPDDCFQDSDCAYEYSICDDGTCACVNPIENFEEQLFEIANNGNTYTIQNDDDNPDYYIDNYNPDYIYIPESDVGVQIEYPDIYLNTGMAENLNLISYPFQEDFLNANLLDVLSYSFTDEDGVNEWPQYTAIVIYFNINDSEQHIINLLYFGGTFDNMFLVDTSGTFNEENGYKMPPGAVIFNSGLSKAGVINWRYLPLGDEPEDDDDDGE